jgi:predicted O-linked N-acetylglucosamine transferase (SPINDLY family)
MACNQLPAAIASLQRAIAEDPTIADAHNNLGVAHRRGGQVAEACQAFASAVAIDPRHVDAHCNLGSVQQATGELLLAAASFQRCLGLDPRCAAASLGLAQIHELLGEAEQALTTLQAAESLNPSHAELQFALAVSLHRAGQLEAAVRHYGMALDLNPGLAAAWRDRGRALETLEHLSEALASYRQALALAPTDGGALAGLLSCCVRICQWSSSAQVIARLEALPGGLQSMHPFLALSVCASPGQLQQIARARCSALGISETRPLRWQAVKSPRLRVAYCSSDLRDHAVAHVMAGVLEHHEASRFEIHAVCLQPEDRHSEIGRRLHAAVAHWHDVSSMSDTTALSALRELEIDIAVDLNGYTVGGRPGLFARRIAPVQVNYLGYAGTLGAPYMDYVLADEVVIPAGEERWYSEQVVRLPHCYLPTDDRRPIGPRPTRAQAGLPESGFVYCAFTNAYKINPPVFAVWMRLLDAVTGSVLWLRAMGEEARSNLLREAERYGIAPERLVFAPRVASMADHLARQSLADLYLDTLPYNAHSTACDALWAGVPVLSCAGQSFASRVAASALTAAGLPELVTHSLAEYEQQALALAQQPARLAELRTRLATQRSSVPLFNTALYTRHLEQAFHTMHERVIRGQNAAAFRVITQDL